MSLLIIGVVLWCSVHLIPSLATGLKQGLVGTLGKKGYRGVFSSHLWSSSLWAGARRRKSISMHYQPGLGPPGSF